MFFSNTFKFCGIKYCIINSAFIYGTLILYSIITKVLYVISNILCWHIIYLFVKPSHGFRNLFCYLLDSFYIYREPCKLYILILKRSYAIQITQINNV